MGGRHNQDYFKVAGRTMESPDDAAQSRSAFAALRAELKRRAPRARPPASQATPRASTEEAAPRSVAAEQHRYQAAEQARSAHLAGAEVPPAAPVAASPLAPPTSPRTAAREPFLAEEATREAEAPPTADTTFLRWVERGADAVHRGTRFALDATLVGVRTAMVPLAAGRYLWKRRLRERPA